MGRIFARTFEECGSKSLILKIVCEHCKREVFRHPDHFVGMKTRSGLVVRRYHDIEEIEPFLRCRGPFDRPGCGKRGAKISAHFLYELKVPEGVPALTYLNGSEADRARLVDAARK